MTPPTTMRRARLARSVPVLAALAAFAPSSAPAFEPTLDLAVKVEPGFAMPLGRPQTDVFGAGGGFAARAALGIVDWFGAQVAIGGYGFAPAPPPPGGAAGSSVGVFALGAGPRLLLPSRWRRGGFTPWLDLDLLYAHTGPLDRFAWSFGLGVTNPLPLGRRPVALGLFVRYLQIVQPARDGFDDGDAKILIVGASAEVGLWRPTRRPRDGDGDGLPDERDRCPTVAGPADSGGCPPPDGDKDGVRDSADACADVPGPVENKGCPWPDTDGDGVVDRDDACPKIYGPELTFGCPDGDSDGVADGDDRCPDVAGLPENKGCPRYSLVAITSKAIVLAEKIAFVRDKTQLQPRCIPGLDEVVKVLIDAPALRVRIEAHTDAAPDAKRNQDLSTAQAAAVKRYLVDNGIEEGRLEAAGMGSSAPREGANRRVELLVIEATKAAPAEKDDEE